MTDPRETMTPASTDLAAAAGPMRIELAPVRNQWWDVWDQFRRHRGAMIGAAFFIFILLFAYVGPQVWRVDPGYLNIQARGTSQMIACFGVGGAARDSVAAYEAAIAAGGAVQDNPPRRLGVGGYFGAMTGCFADPEGFSAAFEPFKDRRIKVSWAHPLGTDQKGTDTLAWLMSGGQTSISVGLTAMLLSILIGTLVGVVAGYFKRLDGILMRMTDLFLALPLLPLLLVMVMLFRQSLSSAFGPETGIFILIVVAIGVTSWMPTARIVRGDVLALKEHEFVLAARSIGTRPGRIIRRHIIPNVMSPIMVAATLGIANAIITESALSFLGLGFPSDYPSWGRLLNDGVQFMQQNPERVLWPGLAISLTVLSVNYMGDGLRDALDPRIRGQ
ncbi:MAG: peptide/nickel transport system permease protein [Rhodobacteraceae bacterium HLUCCA08]|nr:MAG: peptide/nickel transport system permease protein [Rhodobacteraceae bacterium HLUCCA08]